ncbi:MAG: hypothetical protein R3D57_19530 [Hyphomicrobiaceae bacterium]
MGVLQPADPQSESNVGVVRLLSRFLAANGLTNPGLGTGTLIAPGFVLSASHNFWVDDVTASVFANAGNPLVDRVVDELVIQLGYAYGVTTDERTVAAPEVTHLRGYNLEVTTANDIALVRLPEAMSVDIGKLPGLVAFADSNLLTLLAVRVVGYPDAPGDVAGQPDGERLFQATDSVRGTTDGGVFQYEVQSFGGLSGGPVFVSMPGVDGELLAGVHTFLNPQNGVTGGSDLRLDELLQILTTLEIGTSGANASDYRFSYLFGSEPFFGFGGGDTIAGSYRRDVIRGLGGDDRLESQGLHDLIEGGAGDDILIGDGAFVGQSADDAGNANYDQFGNDFLDGGQNVLLPENDIVLAGVDHTGATLIEIGNWAAHQGVFDAAWFPGVALSDDVVAILGARQRRQAWRAPSLQGGASVA